MLNDILAVIETQLNGLNIFKSVKRGLVAIEDLKHKDFPCVRYNVDKIELNDNMSTFDRQVLTAFVNYLVYYKSNKSSDYFLDVDNIRSQVLKFFTCLMPDIDSSCLNISFELAKEEINDDYLNGLYVLRVIISIDYVIR